MERKYLSGKQKCGGNGLRALPVLTNRPNVSSAKPEILLLNMPRPNKRLSQNLHYRGGHPTRRHARATIPHLIDVMDARNGKRNLHHIRRAPSLKVEIGYEGEMGN